MNTKWQTSTIDEIKASKPNAISMGPFGSNIKSDNFVPVGVPVIRGGNLNDWRFYDSNFVFLTEEKANQLRTANAFPNDLIFTHRGTLGQVGIIPKNAKHPRYVVSQSGMKLTCDESKANPLYVFYFFRSPLGQHELLKNISQTGVPAIASPLTTLKGIRIPLPPLPVQRRIADILGALDDKIECNRRINQTLEAMAQALYKHWFVDFGPFRGGEFVDSELGEIPQGWEVKTIGELCATQYGHTASATQEPIGPRFLRITDMNKHFLVDWESVPFCKIGDADLHRYRLAERDILVSRMADPGKVIMADGMKEDAVFASYLIRLKPNNPAMAYWLYYFLRSSVYETFISNSESGTVQKNLNARQLTSPKIAVPPVTALEQFSEQVVPLRQHQIADQKEISLLNRTRDYLLPKLLSGEVEVKAV